MKKKNIPKEDAYQVFIEAFRISEIACKSEYDKEGNLLTKPEEKWYLKLAEFAAVYNPELRNNRNYPTYLKDKFNAIKRILYNPEISEFSYWSEFFDPLIQYSQQKGNPKGAVTFYNKVIYTPKAYSLFNIWRMPDFGQLSKSGKQFIFQSENNTVFFQLPLETKLKEMSPLAGTWVEIKSQRGKVYLANTGKKGLLESPEAIVKFLKS